MAKQLLKEAGFKSIFGKDGNLVQMNDAKRQESAHPAHHLARRLVGLGGRW